MRIKIIFSIACFFFLLTFLPPWVSVRMLDPVVCRTALWESKSKATKIWLTGRQVVLCISVIYIAVLFSVSTTEVFALWKTERSGSSDSGFKVSFFETSLYYPPVVSNSFPFFF